MEQSNNKRVAKNTIALALRMVLATVVGLYTSRIVLQALGVDDYGIYGVIGGVVGMASFLNSSMAGATSRFITFELGTGNQTNLKKIFSNAFIIHLVIALVVAILAETIGLWFVNNRMNFPADRMFAVNVLYQFTILSMVVNFTQIPYSADIIAHERMSIYAYFEIINVILKLGIVYLLLIVNTDRLILYAALTLCVSIISALIYRIYCMRHFSEARIQFRLDKAVLKEMLLFSGYDLYGNMCVVAKNQGQPIIINMFFGVVANAGATIATTINGTVKGFTSSLLHAYRPQIIKQYSINDIERMQYSMTLSAQTSLLIYGAISIPLIIEAPSVLQLWLGQIPEYSVTFLRLLLISLFFDNINLTNNTAIHATGDIRYISFISGSFFLLSPIISWILLKHVIYSADVIYYVDIALYIIISTLSCIFVKKQISGFKLCSYAVRLLRSLVCAIVSLVSVGFISYILTKSLPDDSLHKFLIIGIITLINMLVLTGLNLLIAYSKTERHNLLNIAKSKYKSLRDALIHNKH